MFIKYLLEGIKTVIVAVIVSFFLILACAGISKMFSLSANWVNVMNMIIKALSIVIAVFICFKYSRYGWLRGSICGLIYILLSSVTFGLIAKTPIFDVAFLSDLLLGVVSGMIAGAISVNFRKNEAD